MNLLKAIIIVALLTGTSHGITYRPDVTKSKYEEFGKKHGCVGQIVSKVKNTDHHSSGSAVVIGPHIVLTAGHVMTDVEDSIFVLDGKIYPIKAAISPSNFNMNKMGHGDLAVCYVEQEIPQDFYVSLYGKNDEVNKVCSIAGWGRSGTFETGHQNTNNERLAGSNKVDKVDRDLLIISPTKKNEKNGTTLECIVSPGDSGGGMFIDGKLAGIHSILITDMKGATGKDLTGKYHCYSGSTRISTFKDWIEKTSNELINYYKLVDQVNEVLRVK